MRDQPWKNLLECLTDSEFDSPYLDRLRSRVEIAQGREGLQREILQEIAQALGRSEDKVNEALLELEMLEAEIAREADGNRRRSLVETFNRKRESARRALRDLVIHREALGMRRNKQLAEIYPIPARKSLRSE
ncbi:MAG: hypothetical protein JXA30_21395 [Deltaproteobacteria bacterium]|nr:hypothetical protein [Deltaproteobacteria bacterium]